MKYVFSCLLIACGLAALGHFLGSALIAQTTTQRLITVKGLAERSVKADTGTWYIGFTASDNSFTQALRGIENARAAVVDFLGQNGIHNATDTPGEQVTLAQFSVTDTQAQSWNSNTRGHRFIINAGIQVRTGNLDALKATSLKVAELAAKGVLLTSSNSPTYTFNGLNGIKPDMLAESIRNARAAADSLAQEAGARITALYSATQGMFDIQGADSSLESSSQVDKTVRVVSTIQYYVD